MTLYARQQKMHRYKEQTFGLCGRRRGWDVSREQHRNMYTIKGETDHQPRLDAWDRVLRAGALGWPWGMGWGGRWEGCSGWGTHVHPWLTHVTVWQKPEKEMATHSSVLAWRIPWTEQPGGSQSIGSQKVGHYWARTHGKSHYNIVK